MIIIIVVIIKPRSPFDTQEYYKDVLEQAENNQRLRSKKYEKDKLEDKKMMMENMDRLNREYNDNCCRQKMNQRNMDATNRRLIELKQERQKEQHLKDLDEERKNLDDLKLRNKQAQERKDRQKEETMQIYNENYNNYLRNKENQEKQEKLDKINDRKL